MIYVPPPAFAHRHKPKKPRKAAADTPIEELPFSAESFETKWICHRERLYSHWSSSDGPWSANFTDDAKRAKITLRMLSKSLRVKEIRVEHIRGPERHLAAFGMCNRGVDFRITFDDLMSEMLPFSIDEIAACFADGPRRSRFRSFYKFLSAATQFDDVDTLALNSAIRRSKNRQGHWGYGQGFGKSEAPFTILGGPFDMMFRTNRWHIHRHGFPLGGKRTQHSTDDLDADGLIRR